MTFDANVTSGRKLTLNTGVSIDDNDDKAREAINQVILKAGVSHKGEWFEVWYPGTDASNFDVVRVVNGEIETYPVDPIDEKADVYTVEEEASA